MSGENFLEWVQRAEINLRVQLEVVPPWLLALCAIISPVFIVAWALLLGIYGLIGAALFFGALLFVALSYFQLHTRILFVIVYEIYASMISIYLGLLAACLVFRECL